MATSGTQQAGTSALPCDEILRIAQQDAQSIYGDLSFFRIILKLEEDGWHVDYDAVRPMMAGGGPHYVIDPGSGLIVFRRYEQ